MNMNKKIKNLIKAIIYLANKEKKTITLNDIEYKKIELYIPSEEIKELRKFISLDEKVEG